MEQQGGIGLLLHDVLNFLTGDRWQMEFCKRKKPLSAPDAAADSVFLPA